MDTRQLTFHQKFASHVQFEISAHHHIWEVQLNFYENIKRGQQNAFN